MHLNPKSYPRWWLNKPFSKTHIIQGVKNWNIPHKWGSNKKMKPPPSIHILQFHSSNTLNHTNPPIYLRFKWRLWTNKSLFVQPFKAQGGILGYSMDVKFEQKICPIVSPLATKTVELMKLMALFYPYKELFRNIIIMQKSIQKHHLQHTLPSISLQHTLHLTVFPTSKSKINL